MTGGALRIRRVSLWVRGYYGNNQTIRARLYQPHLGDGLPKKAVWRRDGRHIYFRCTGCRKINRNTVSTFATSRNPLCSAFVKKIGIKDIGVLYRCIRCNHCQRGLSGVVLLGFNRPAAFLKRTS